MKNKSQILQDCCHYFYQHGFHGASIDLVAKSANVTKRTLYSYFDSKDNLIIESLNFRHQQFMQTLEKTLAEFSFEKTADGYLQFLKNWLLSADFFGCMFINACGEFSDLSHPVHTLTTQHKQAILTLLQSRFNQANINNAEQRAMKLFIYGEGLIVARQSGILSDSMLKSLDKPSLNG